MKTLKVEDLLLIHEMVIESTSGVKGTTTVEKIAQWLKEWCKEYPE
jgi:hypothetical protein